MYLEIIESIIPTLGNLSASIGLALVAVIGLSMVLLPIVFSLIILQYSIEFKTSRALAKINKYLESHPYVTNENLVEFNKLMKRIPAPMRVQWQQFMVNRDKKPSEFFSSFTK